MPRDGWLDPPDLRDGAAEDPRPLDPLDAEAEPLGRRTGALRTELPPELRGVDRTVGDDPPDRTAELRSRDDVRRWRDGREKTLDLSAVTPLRDGSGEPREIPDLDGIA